MLSNEIPPADLEKSGAAVGISTSRSNSVEKSTFESSSSEPTHLIPVPTAFQKWNARIESLAGLEARGIVRVLPEERQSPSFLGYAQMAMVWFGANVVANNLAVGTLGPLLFNLGFVDSALMATFGSFLGSVPTAYMSIWGAQSGNRTMVGFLCATECNSRKLIQSDCGSILHGILARKDRLLPQYGYYGRIRYHCLHY